MKLSRITIFILSLSLATIVGWLIYQILVFQTKDVVIDSVDSKYTQPLNPNLDPNLLKQLQERNQ